MRTLATAVALVSLATGTSLDQGGSGAPPVVLELRLLIDHSMPATIRVRAGDRAKVGADGRATVGLIPAVLDTSLDLRVVRLIANADGSETVVECGRYVIEKGSVQTVDAGDIAIDVEWTAVVPVEVSTGAIPGGPCSQCCVICDGREVCACWVQTSCGSCCCPHNCACPSNPPPTATGASGPARR